MSESEAWKALIATAMRRNVVVAVGQHREAVEQEARASLLAQLDEAEVREKELRAALEQIHDSETPLAVGWDGWREVTRLKDIAHAALSPRAALAKGKP